MKSMGCPASRYRGLKAPHGAIRFGMGSVFKTLGIPLIFIVFNDAEPSDSISNLTLKGVFLRRSAYRIHDDSDAAS